MTEFNKIAQVNRDEILKELTLESEYIHKLVDCIPANIYFDHKVRNKITAEKHAFMDNKVKALKRGSSESKDYSAKNKHKRARLDPGCQKSVSEVHEELSKKKRRKKKPAPPSQQRATNIEELKDLLHHRINEFKTKRKGSALDDPLKKKKLKTKEKKVKQKKVTIPQADEASMQANRSKKVKATPKPSFNSEGKVIYGKLDFTDENIVEGKKKKNEFGGKNYKSLIYKAEKKIEKIEALKETDLEKAKVVEEKERWKKAILRAENVKVKDDPQLLKKSLKKQEKMKNKKGKAWKERIENVEAKKEARQERRTRNIQKRQKDKLQHKIKRAKKKGRVITGI